MLDQMQIFDGINFRICNTSHFASEVNASLDGKSAKHNATNDDTDANE